MNPVIFSLIVLFLLIFINSFFVMSEMAVVSSRKAKLKVKAEAGHKSYKAVLELRKDPTAFLSTTQIVITLIGILAGAFGEATLSESINNQLDAFPFLSEYGHYISVGIVVVGTTFFSLFFGELLPKRIALSSPEKISSVTVYPVRFMTYLFLPFVKMLSIASNLFLKLLRIKSNPDTSMSQEEIRFILREGEEHGLYKSKQRDMAESVFELHETRVESIMIPRPDVIYIDQDLTKPLLKQEIIDKSAFNYLLVCKGGLDEITGVIKTKDILRSIIKRDFKSIANFIIQPLYIPQSVSVLKALELMAKNKTHFAVIIDEYGGMSGTVTLNDIAEEIIGNVPANIGETNKEIIKRKDGSYLLDGVLSIEDFEDTFGSLNIANAQFNTIAGFVINEIGRIPRESDTVQYGAFIFEVIDMDGYRIDKILMKTDDKD